MAASWAESKAPWWCMALAASMLLGACTTTTTLVSGDDDATVQSGQQPARASTQPSSSREYMVQRGDTLYSIAFRQRVDLRELIAWNDLAEPYTIYPGQRLRVGEVPARRATATYAPPPSSTTDRRDTQRIAAGRPEDASTPPKSVRDDRAVASAPVPVSARAPAPPPAPARALQDPPPPPVSSMPAIPIAVDDGVREAVVDDARPDSSGTPNRGMPLASAPVPAPVAVRAMPVAPPPPPPLPQTPTEPEREVLAVRSAPTRMVGGIGWRWPNGAALVGRFAADDEARQGIRLQGAPGTPVNASADGEVVYSGNGLVGLGELVIIKHGADYLSAYGLNRKRLVSEGQKVKAGEPVAEMGNSAGMAGLLHFEVRRGGRPIDPLSVLPPR